MIARAHASDHPEPGTQETTRTEPDALVSAGLRAAVNIAAAWHLSASEMATLLGVSRATYYRLKERADAERTALPAEAARIRESLVSQPLRERLSLLLGIYGGLQIIYANNRAYGEEWVRRPNTSAVFRSRRPIDVMLSGNVLDLALVRQHVDAMRG